MNAVNPIEPSESIDFQGQSQLIAPFCSFKSCSQLKTGYYFRMPLWAALRDSEEHLPFAG